MYFGDHPANCGRIGALHYLLHAAKTQSADGLAHAARAANEAAYPLDFKRFILRGSHGRPKTALGSGRFFRSFFARFGDLGSIF